jgi:prevent-host-death family protein
VLDTACVSKVGWRALRAERNEVRGSIDEARRGSAAPREPFFSLRLSRLRRGRLREPFLSRSSPEKALQELQQYCILQQRGSAMSNYSTSDLSRKSGDIIAEALRKPVTITQRNKPRLVLLSIEDYRRLTKRSDSRKSETIDRMSDKDFAKFRRAVEKYTEQSDER